MGALTTWAYIGALSRTSFAVNTSGQLFSWGTGSAGVLGSGASTNRSSPVQVGALTTWASVSSAASDVTHAVKTDGTLWGWGAVNLGEIGNGDSSLPHYSSPVQIGAATDWIPFVQQRGHMGAALRTPA